MTRNGHGRSDVLCSSHAYPGNTMSEIKTEFLFTIDLDFEFSVLGDTP